LKRDFITRDNLAAAFSTLHNHLRSRHALKGILGEYIVARKNDGLSRPLRSQKPQSVSVDRSEARGLANGEPYRHKDCRKNHDKHDYDHDNHHHFTSSSAVPIAVFRAVSVAIATIAVVMAMVGGAAAIARGWLTSDVNAADGIITRGAVDAAVATFTA
jgi:hypothetical protein